MSYRQLVKRTAKVIDGLDWPELGWSSLCVDEKNENLAALSAYLRGVVLPEA